MPRMFRTWLSLPMLQAHPGGADSERFCLTKPHEHFCTILAACRGYF